MTHTHPPDVTTSKIGRPKASMNSATARLVAALHRAGRSHREIGAALGWLRPDEDWTEPKVRHRIESRVRSWLRKAEALPPAADPTLPITGRCATCRWWRSLPPRVATPAAVDRPDDWRACHKTTTRTGQTPANPPTLAFVKASHAALLTHRAFGCVQWEIEARP